MKTPLPSGMTIAALREAVEQCIAEGQLITISPPDLLAILVSLDLRVRLDRDVELVTRVAAQRCGDNDVQEAAIRIRQHQPLPDMSKVPS